MNKFGIHDNQPLEVAYNEAIAYAQELENEVEKHRRVDDAFERRTTKLALVSGIGRKITSILDLDSLLEATAHLIREMFNYDHVGVFLVSADRLTLRAVSGVYASHLPDDFSLRKSEGLLGRVAAQGERLVINDFQYERTFHPTFPDSNKSRAQLCLPIVLAEEVIGVLDIQSRQPDVFDQLDILALEALANQIAVAIENANLHEKVQKELIERKQTEKVLQETLEELQLWADEKAPDLKRANQVLREQIAERNRAETEITARAHQQAIVAEFGQRVLAGVALPKLMDEAVALIAKTLAVEYCQILELQPEAGDVLLLRAGIGWKEGLVGKLTIDAEANSQMGFTLLHNEPVIVKDTHSEERFKVSPHLLEHGVVSSISVNIDGESWPFGVLGAHTTSRRVFTKDDINFLLSVANILAQAIERMHTEKALRESEEKYRTLIEKSGDAVFLIHGGRFEVINKRFTELFGVTQEEANAPDFVFTNIISSKSRKLVAELHRADKKTAQTMSLPPYEFTAIDKDDNEIEVELTVSYPTYRGGLATQGIIRDITERKRIEAERERAYEQAQQLAVELSTKIEEEQHQREISANLAEVVASTSLDLSTDEILNHILLKLKQLIPYDSAAIFLMKDDDFLIMRAAQGFEEDVVNQEFDYTQNLLFQELRDTKSYIYIPDTRQDDRYQFWSGASEIRSWIGAPLVVAQDMIGYLTVDRCEPDSLTPDDAKVAQAYAHQVAQTIYNAQLFEQLRQTQAQLIQGERLAALGQMAATVAHELRNPLMAIKIGVEYLVHDVPEGDPRQRGAALMQANMERIDRIIDDILYVARAPKPNLILGSLHAVLENEVIFWEANLKERGVSFRYDLVPDAPPVMLDFDQLGRVFSNLIGNAADAAGASGVLCLTMTCRNDHQIVVVEDNGSGIPVEIQEKIFEPFFTTKSRGTGLGLAIVKQIVENHSGRISLWSEPGAGTKFTIVLPDAKESSSE